MKVKHYIPLDNPEQFEIIKTEWRNSDLNEFCEKYNIARRQWYKLLWQRNKYYKEKSEEEKEVSRQRVRIHNEKVQEVYLKNRKENISKIIAKFNISESKVKKLLCSYTFKEILRSKDINNIKDLIQIR